MSCRTGFLRERSLHLLRGHRSSSGLHLESCKQARIGVIVGDESVELKADEAARLDGYAGEIKLCSKEGAKLMLAKAKEI